MGDTASLSNTRTSEMFNALDADIVFRSSDQVLFHIHSINLRNATGALPPAESSPGQNEIADLNEDSSTLELMFQFIYPQRQPRLAPMEFTALALLAEAVEKYKVYPAMQLCNLEMAQALPDHAVQVLDYAGKHDYPELMDKAAPLVTLDALSKVVGGVSPTVVRAWHFTDDLTEASQHWEPIHAMRNLGPSEQRYSNLYR